MSPILDEALIAANQQETADVQRLQNILNTGTDLELVGPDGQAIRLPEPLANILRQSARFLAQGEVVAILSTEATCTQQEAADLLDISSAFLDTLLERHELPFLEINMQRRIRLSDLLDYKRQREKTEREGLAEIARLSQEMGLYDLS